MTPIAPSGIAHRTIAELSQIAGGGDGSKAEQPAADPQQQPVPSISVRFATSVKVRFDAENQEYDLIFQSRRKAVSADGDAAMSCTERPTAAVTLTAYAIGSLFDQLEPLVKVTRHQNRQPLHAMPPELPASEPARSADPEPTKKRVRTNKSWSEIGPVGFDNILRVAEKMRDARQEAIKRSNGATVGRGYAMALSPIYDADDDLRDLPKEIRRPLSELLPHLDLLREWAKTKPQAQLDAMRVSQIRGRFLSSLTASAPVPPEPAEPKPAKPALRKVNRSNGRDDDADAEQMPLAAAEVE